MCGQSQLYSDEKIDQVSTKINMSVPVEAECCRDEHKNGLYFFSSENQYRKKNLSQNFEILLFFKLGFKSSSILFETQNNIPYLSKKSLKMKATSVTYLYVNDHVQLFYFYSFVKELNTVVFIPFWAFFGRQRSSQS